MDRYDENLLGHRIRAIRIAKGLSLTDLHLRTGYAVSTICEVELGHSNPTLDLLRAIAAGLGVPLLELFTAGPVNDPATTDLARFGQWVSAGDLVRLYRLSLGFTLQEISRLTGYSVGYHAGVELNNRPNPCIAMLFATSLVLEVDPGDLMFPTRTFLERVSSNAGCISVAGERLIRHIGSQPDQVRAWLEQVDPIQRLDWVLHSLVEVCEVSVRTIAGYAHTSTRSVRDALLGSKEPRLVWGLLVGLASNIPLSFFLYGKLDEPNPRLPAA